VSLKAFHIVFIVASTLLAFGFGAWCLRNYFSDGHGGVDLVLGSLALISGVALIVYGRYFLRKLRHISYL